MEGNRETIDLCGRLLESELAAVETYDLVMGRFGRELEQPALQAIRDGHQVNAERLREHLSGLGATPPDATGIWSAFAEGMAETTILLEKFPTLAALEEGEEHGIDAYEEALRNPGASEEIKIVIRQELLPALSAHISALDRLRAR